MKTFISKLILSFLCLSFFCIFLFILHNKKTAVSPLTSEYNMPSLEDSQNIPPDSTKISSPTVSDNDTFSLELSNLDEIKNTIYIPDLQDFYRGKNLQIKNIYSTDISRGTNHYWIDDSGILWGEGTSEYGQLGYFSNNLSYSSEPQKIAENVIHVDFSGEYFLIFLTEDHKLYGMGGNPSGILSSSERENFNSLYLNNMNTIVTPTLLLSDVDYARCGTSTIITLQNNGNVFLLGNPEYIPHSNEDYHAPRIIMNNAKYVTTFFSSYAVIDNDNNLYTWGDNSFGQCGHGHYTQINQIKQVAENIDCAWFGTPAFNHKGEPSAKNTLFALTKEGLLLACGVNTGILTEPVENSDQQPSHKQIRCFHTLEPIAIKEYQLPDIKTATLGSSREDLSSFFKMIPHTYSEGITEEGYLHYHFSEVNWSFIFNTEGYLIEISCDKNDAMEKGLLHYGASYEDVIAAYGDNFLEEIDEYLYRTLQYDRGNYIFQVFLYDDLRCGGFKIFLK